MEKKVIVSDEAPRAVGAYSQGVVAEGGRLLFISGQVGFDPETMEMVSGGVEAEAKQALENIGAILSAAGATFSSIVKATVYLVDIGDFAAVNQIYASYFASEPPARAAFAVKALPVGARVEIEAIAIL